jgi:hypothetical protein
VVEWLHFLLRFWFKFLLIYAIPRVYKAFKQIPSLINLDPEDMEKYISVPLTVDAHSESELIDPPTFNSISANTEPVNDSTGGYLFVTSVSAK